MLPISSSLNSPSEQESSNSSSPPLSSSLTPLLTPLPKPELHLHYDGAFSPSTLLTLLLKKALTDPKLESIVKEIELPWSPGDTLQVRQLLLDAVKLHTLEVSKLHPQIKHGAVHDTSHDMPHPASSSDAYSHPHPSLHHFSKLCTCFGNRSLFDMLLKFYTFMPIVSGNLDALGLLAKELVDRQVEGNVLYTEIRYSPHLLAEVYNTETETIQINHITPKAVIEAITKALKERCAYHNKGREKSDPVVFVTQILCLICWRPEWSDETADLAYQFSDLMHIKKDESQCKEDEDKDAGVDLTFIGTVVGLDLAAGEDHFNLPHLYEPHHAALKKGKEKGLHVTIHAGEVTSGEEIKRSVEEYGAERIGHGYRIINAILDGGSEVFDAGVLEFVLDNKINFELCPTSSLETGGWNTEGSKNVEWGKHPIKKIMECGYEKGNGNRVEEGEGLCISCSINTDDPSVFKTNINKEYQIVHIEMNVSLKRIVKSCKDGMLAGFCGNKWGVRAWYFRRIEMWEKENGVAI